MFFFCSKTPKEDKTFDDSYMYDYYKTTDKYGEFKINLQLIVKNTINILTTNNLWYNILYVRRRFR